MVAERGDHFDATVRTTESVKATARPEGSGESAGRVRNLGLGGGRPGLWITPLGLSEGPGILVTRL